MKQPQHTPAPDVRAALREIVAAVNCNYDPATIRAEGMIVRAEAALAAPDTTPALLAALDNITRTFEQDPWTAPRYMQVQRDTTIKEARAAIAAATGANERTSEEERKR